jgi:hypothetical protein
MSKEMGPKERAQREMREARFTENAKITTGIRKAAAEGLAILERQRSVGKSKLGEAIREATERMKNRPAKGKRKPK